MMFEEAALSGPDFAASAESASLVYCSDTEPGFRRVRAGRGFRYVDAKGRKVERPEAIDRFDALVIPPAWTDVWIAPDPRCHLQATGRDIRGRKQYRYHEGWTACRDEVKYAGLADFAEALPKLRATVERDLRRRELPRERVLASVVWLLDNAMIRVGNAAYARDNKSFGLTTLRDRHVRIEGAKLRFSFRGKSGKEWRLQITDRRIARIVKGAQDIPGQHLFQYLDDDGARQPIGSQDVNAYIREATGDTFTSKHFRTWGATVRAATLLAEREAPQAERAAARILNEVVDDVAAKLGNTRTVCRQCYVHPLVFDRWRAGELGGDLEQIGRRYRRTPAGLDRDEALVLRWLQAKS